MQCYYDFCIPTLKKGKGKPQILNRNPGEKKLQDLPAQKALIIKGEIFPSYDITLKYKHTTDRDFNDLYFQAQKLTSEGFLIYKLELDEERIQNDYVCKCLSQEMHKAFYHYIKDFFHRHIFHAATEDSLLPTYFSQEEIHWQLATTRKQILEPIITNYSLKFSGYLQEWKDDLSLALCDICNNRNISKNIGILRNIMRTNHDIFGEAQYCEFLLQNFPTEISQKDKKEIRETVLSLKSLHEDIAFWYNHYTSRISFFDGRNGVRLGTWGIIVGVISLILTLYLEYSAPDINVLKLKTEQHIDSLHQSTQQLINDRMQLLQVQNDSLRIILQESNKKPQQTKDKRN